MTNAFGCRYSKNGNNVANGDEFLHPRRVPVGRPDAAVTGSAADGLRLISAMDANMWLA